VKCNCCDNNAEYIFTECSDEMCLCEKCALWIENVNYAREDIDLNKVLKSSGVDSFDRLHTAFCEYLQYQSYIKDIDQLIIDLNYYYDDFKSLNYEIEYN